MGEKADGCVGVREYTERFTLLESIAQKIRTYPEEADIVSHCLSDSEDMYKVTKMAAYNPLEAEHLVWRGVRSAVWGAAMHAVYSRLFCDLADKRGPLTPSILPDSSIYATNFLGPADLSGPQADTFMRVGAKLVRDAADAIFHRPNNYTSALMQQVDAANLACYDVRKRRDNWRRRHQPRFMPGPVASKDWQEGLRDGITDNIHSALFVLEMRQAAAREGGTRRLRQTTLENIDRLSWAGSVTRNVFRSIVNPEDRYAGIYENGPIEHPQCTYNHPSLQNGPWPIPRFCPGQFNMSSPFASEREASERFFRTLGVPCENGVFNLNKAVLALGVCIAQETIWQS